LKYGRAKTYRGHGPLVDVGVGPGVPVGLGRGPGHHAGRHALRGRLELLQGSVGQHGHGLAAVRGLANKRTPGVRSNKRTLRVRSNKCTPGVRSNKRTPRVRSHKRTPGVKLNKRTQHGHRLTTVRGLANKRTPRVKSHKRTQHVRTNKLLQGRVHQHGHRLARGLGCHTNAPRVLS
jgi:hypothetical protein